MRIFSFFFCVAACFGPLLCWLAPYSFIAELATHWQLHMAVAAIVAMLAFGALCYRLEALWMGMIALILALPVFKAYYPPPARPDAPFAHVSLLQFNVYYANDQFAKNAVPWILRQNADIVVLQEIGQARANELAPLGSRYPYSRIEINPRHPAFGMAIFSKFPIEKYERIAAGTLNFYSKASVRLPSGESLKLYEMHPPPPVTRDIARQRNRDIALLGQVLSQDASPYRLVIGDLNGTIYSPYFRQLQQAAGLHNAQQRFQVEGTWNAALPAPLHIGIDHALASFQVRFASRKVGPALGSDHLPIYYRLALYR